MLNYNSMIFSGPAFPKAFLDSEIERVLKNIPSAVSLEKQWETYRNFLKKLRGGLSVERKVANYIYDPLKKILGYETLEKAEKEYTREGLEDAGFLFKNSSGEFLRAFSLEMETDIDAPNLRGRAFRFAPMQIAKRVLSAKGERICLITNGMELRVLVLDPTTSDSYISISLSRTDGWRSQKKVPDSFRLFIALAAPSGVKKIPEITEKARLFQTKVTDELRIQAKLALGSFLDGILRNPENKEILHQIEDRHELAKELWREGLIIVYRLLFIFRMESSPDPVRVFSFASNSLWRNSYSPNYALSRTVRKVLDENANTGEFIESTVKICFRLFMTDLQYSEFRVTPLGGYLFDPAYIPLLSQAKWGEKNSAGLLDKLLWNLADKKGGRQKIHYGSLDVEDLGRVYESLLELEPGISKERLCRLQRDQLEVAVPYEQGEQYKTDSGAKTKINWIEEIPEGRFFLRAGLGRKSTGSYYTSRPFVKFLVQETLNPILEQISPETDPNPSAVLKLKIIDPAMGSGHFLVEACRFLGEKIYKALRILDELASDLEEREDAESLKTANEYRKKIIETAGSEDSLPVWLPSRSVDGKEAIFSAQKAEALCRRLAALHCLYGVDKNPLAVELAKLSLWMESHSEGFPLTFLEHRLICGDSLTGGFLEHIFTLPGSGEELDGLFTQKLKEKLVTTLEQALQDVKALEQGIDTTLANVEQKQKLKSDLDKALGSIKILAKAWTGGVMLGKPKKNSPPEDLFCDDTAYIELLKGLLENKSIEEITSAMSARQRESILKMMELGKDSVWFDLEFPEVFYPEGKLEEIKEEGETKFQREGFSVVLGNPPWDRMLPNDKEFFASYDFSILDKSNAKERDSLQNKLLQDTEIKKSFHYYISEFRGTEEIISKIYKYQIALIDGEKTIGKQDAFRAFMEKNYYLTKKSGYVGVLVPSAFHANEGATGVRRLYFEKMNCKICYSFENKKKLFEIDSRMKFATVISQKGEKTKLISCGFYLHDMEWLFQGVKKTLEFSYDFIKQTGGEYLSLVEIKSEHDLKIANKCFIVSKPFLNVYTDNQMRFGREMNTSDDLGKFTLSNSVLNKDSRLPEASKELLGMNFLIVKEGKNFWHFNDMWEDPPQYIISINNILHKKNWLKSSTYYRLAYRKVASSTNERTFVICFLTPHSVSVDSIYIELTSYKRKNYSALKILSVLSTFTIDFITRLLVSANVNLFIVNRIPIPNIFSNLPSEIENPQSPIRVHPCPSVVNKFLSHLALILTCNHEGYAALWKEQIVDMGGPEKEFPIVGDEDERWKIRSYIDAVVAEAYGLEREEYEYVLSTFSHKSYPKAPELCLAAFDELKQIGIEAFCKKYDPYHELPLNENLPKPVIEIPGLEDELEDSDTLEEESDEAVEELNDEEEVKEKTKAKKAVAKKKSAAKKKGSAASSKAGKKKEDNRQQRFF